MSQPKRILFVTRRPLLAVSFRELLETAGWEAYPVVVSPDQWLQCLPPDRAALVAIDAESGVSWDTLGHLRPDMPSSRFVVWCRHATPEMVQKAMAAGLDGLLSMRLPLEEAAEALHRVWLGERQFRFEGELQPRVAQPRLTPREQQVVSLVMQGLRNREIAAALKTTEGSIKVYVNRVFTKTGVKSRQELALLARGVIRRRTAPSFDAVWMFSGFGASPIQPQGDSHQ